MQLFFTNDSKQMKSLGMTDYPEDVYDEITAFFEEHRAWPHFLEVTKPEDAAKIPGSAVDSCLTAAETGGADRKAEAIAIYFGSTSERFIVTDCLPEDIAMLRTLCSEYRPE